MTLQTGGGPCPADEHETVSHGPHQAQGLLNAVRSGHQVARTQMPAQGIRDHL
jgi:hypothetical protein